MKKIACLEDLARVMFVQDVQLLGQIVERPCSCESDICL